MIEKSNLRVWISNGELEKYHLMGPGFTGIKETYKTAILETPNINSAISGQEILYHVGQIEFSGIWVDDEAIHILTGKKGKRGKDALVTMVIVHAHDNYGPDSTFAAARRVKGYACIENPGSGESPFGARIKGKIIFAEEPLQGVFDEAKGIFAGG